MVIPVHLPDGPKQRRQAIRSGSRPLAYMGVQPESPVNFIQYDKDPTTGDFKDWTVGDMWENYKTNNVWQLVKKGSGAAGAAGIATWVRIGGVTSLKDDAGNVIEPDDITGTIEITGGELINTENPAPGVMRINLDRGTNGQIPISSTGASTEWANLTEGAGINITNGPNSITISSGGFGGDVTLIGNDGSTASTIDGSVNVLGVLPIITEGNLADTFTIKTDGTLAATYTTDAGNAIPAAGILNIVGAAGKIATSGAGSTVTLNTGATVPTSFPTDAGVATPAVGALTVAGGQNINTSGAGSTVTVNLVNTYQVAVAAPTLEIGVVDATQKLGTISIAALKVLLGLP